MRSYSFILYIKCVHFEFTELFTLAGKRKGGSMREKARCCTAHRCLCAHSAPRGRHTCAIHIYPGGGHVCPQPYSKR